MKTYKSNEMVHANARKTWNEYFLELGKRDSRIVALTADLSRSTCTESFRKEIPGRYFNVGIAEQNMIGLAAGLALEGKKPYCVSFAPFLSMRALEQVRDDVCYMNLDVKLIGVYSGVSQAGSTHSGLEDLGIFRGIPNMTVVAASDVGMVKKIFDASASHNGPMYIRLTQGKNDPDIYAEEYQFEIGKAITVRSGNDATIISCGMTLGYAMDAANELSSLGIEVSVIDMHTIKPIDRPAVLSSIAATGNIVTIENHFITNGLGSAVSEIIAEAGMPCRLIRLGIPDTFTCNGSDEQLCKKYGVSTEAVVSAVKGLMAKL